MSKTYDLLIRVPNYAKVATILAALDGAGELVSVVQTGKTGPTKRHRVSGSKSNGIIMELAKGGATVSRTAIEAAFLRAGYNKNSVGPRLSELIKNGKISEVKKHSYKISPSK